MMYNAFPYQLLIELSSKDQAHLPIYAKELLKKMDIPDYDKLEDFFAGELPSASVQREEAVEYFFFVAAQALFYSFYRKDLDAFEKSLDIIRHRMVAIRNVGYSETSLKAWDEFLGIYGFAIKRLVRCISIEQYESAIDELDWTVFEKPFIRQISTILGYVYLNEEEHVQANKARLWLQKSMMDSSPTQNLLNIFLFAEYYFTHEDEAGQAQIERLVNKLENDLSSLETDEHRLLFSCAIEELRLGLHYLLLKFRKYRELQPKDRIELERLEAEVAQFISVKRPPIFVKSGFRQILAKMYAQLNQFAGNELELENHKQKALELIQHGVSLNLDINDKRQASIARLERSRILIDTGSVIPEKELREIMQFFKKQGDYAYYLKASQAFIELLIRNANSPKTYDVILDIFKLGNRKQLEGGYYLILGAFDLANKVFLYEIEQPGISWIIESLDDFFEKIKQVIDNLEGDMELLGTSMIEKWRAEYLRFEPISHFNIRVYFMYQLYQLKMIRIGALMHNDQMGLQMADRMLLELEHENNPLSFIKADWDEFKKVPNDVRNKTLNKCINLSKGDLPLASEHLNFSYRNLRSYITFKEVNRLGFFLDLQQTDNKQLEQGIRYMFYDLYKKGTIFEVVFDMPKFLVKHARSGFYSQDLERELNIKGTTAKKYIKIMMEINLIKQDKTTGRKHYYRLIRENVMKRLGKDQTTLIK